MKNSKTTVILLFFVFLAGLSLLLYPSLANYWNSFRATIAISSYATEVSEMEDEDSLKMFQDALDYNQALAAHGTAYFLTDEEQQQYNSLLDISGSGIMGYVEIPILGVSLPIYHGTEDDVLQIAVGHLDWSSLPVGGESSHSILCGHRGLPSGKLFTDLDKLVEGDIFMVSILNRIMTYEVDQIRIVEPDDVKDLSVVNGKDYCTLQTCTPYGVNTHRLLVRGHRIENIEAAKVARLTAEGIEIEPLIVAPVLAAPFLIVLLLLVLLEPSGKSKKKK